MTGSDRPSDSPTAQTPPEAAHRAFSGLMSALDLSRASEHPDGRDGPAAISTGHDVDDEDVFVGQSIPQPHGRVFGGQVVAQAVVAAGRTVADVPGPTRPIHSLHGYFLRPGDASAPLGFAVERLRDGASFSARRVHAFQFGRPILSMIFSFQVPADGLDHQATMPAAPDPEWVPSAAQELAGIDHPVAIHWSEDRPVDIRHCQGALFITPGRQHAAEQSVWMRAVAQMPDDPLLHSAVLAYASDYTLLESVLRRHGITWADPRLRPASLDHAMWFHRPARADEWILYAQQSPSAQGGRGLGIGTMFAEDGTLVASVAQEGMIRLKGD